MGRFRGRRPAHPTPLDPFANDVIGHPGVREYNRPRREARLSARGRVLWWGTLALILLGFGALILLTR